MATLHQFRENFPKMLSHTFESTFYGLILSLIQNRYKFSNFLPKSINNQP